MPKQNPDPVNLEAPDGAPADPVVVELAETKALLSASQRELETSRKALEAADTREQMLSDELKHRVHNMLAVIQSIFRRTFENGASQDEFAEHFAGRLGAIARHQAGIASLGMDGLELKDMVRDELLTVQCPEGSSCTIKGPPVRLTEKRCELMGLAIHELATNAIKFGALCHRGTLSVEWSLTEAPAALHFRWEETGVPLLSAAPRPQGFGQDLIEQALPYQLGATTEFEFKPGGLNCSITLPLCDNQPPRLSRRL